MSITKETKTKLIKDYAQSGNDTGSAEVQVAILTTRIVTLTEHMKANKKDKACAYGLLKLVNRRKKLLSYIKGKSEDRYAKIIKSLGLRK